MNTTTAKEIERLKRKITALESKAAKAEEKRKSTAIQKIMAIVTKYGFATLAELTADAKYIVKKRIGSPRKRAKITDAIRKAVLADLKKGVDSALAIAKRHGISQPSVNNIKKAAGLTRGKTARPATGVTTKRRSSKASKPRKAAVPKVAATANGPAAQETVTPS